MEPKQERKLNETPNKRISSNVEGVSGELLLKQDLLFNAHDALPLSGATKNSGNITQDLIGLLKIQDVAIGVVRARKDDKERVVLTRIDTSGRSSNYLELLTPGVPFVLGREKLAKDDMTISKRHLVITLSGQNNLLIEDISTNGTLFFTYEDQKNDENIAVDGLRGIFSIEDNQDDSAVDLEKLIKSPQSWGLSGPVPSLIFEAKGQNASGDAVFDYTMIPVEKLKSGAPVKGYEEPFLESDTETPAYYKDRPVICRDSQINGGVYIVPGTQEAIVVDDGTKPKRGESPRPISSVYQKAFDSFLLIAKSNNLDLKGNLTTDQLAPLMNVLLLSVKNTINYDLEASRVAASKYRDKKINLSEFIIEGKGVCRHQALLAGYVLEKLINNGYLQGSVSVDRNYVPSKGGHAWARFTEPGGKVFIVDPAQGYAGTLKESLVKADWNYARPNDRF